MTDSPESPRAVPPLTSRDRAALKARAHRLEPVVHIGLAGLSDSAVAQIDRALDAHELIKVKLGDGERDARAATGDAVCARTRAALVQRVGKVIVLWRPRQTDVGP